MKKILATALALTLTFGTFALPAVESGVCIADKFAVSASAETYGDYEYEILDDGTVEITRYNGKSQTITIPNTINGKKVTSIGEFAFRYCSVLTVTIPNSITSIGSCAFFDSSLASITIPDSVTSIGSEAFSNCNNLTSIDIPDSVSSIGSYAFHGCYNLTKANIPNSVKTLENSVFSCTGLKKVIIPNGVECIEADAFNNCENLTEITIPNSVKRIEYGAFIATGLTNINIPNGVEFIGEAVFSGCSDLKKVSISASVKNIDENAFVYCENLTNIDVSELNTKYSSYDGALFNKDQTRLIYCPNGKNSIIIPATVISIHEMTINRKEIYYCGTEEQFKSIKYYDGDDDYTLIIHYNWVVNKTISSCTISLPTNTQYFRGVRIRPVITIKDGSTVLKYGTDYKISYTNNLSVGTALVKITGIGKYSGSVTQTFDIVQRSIGNCEIMFDSDSYYFNGSRIKPSVAVYTNGTEMYNGNYTVTYSNNLSAGTATITLIGKKNLKGTVTKTFKINPRNIANCTISLTKNSANKYQPKATVKLGSNSVYSGNYTVKYTTSADKKTVKVTLTGKGNLAGTVTKTYTV